MNKFKKFVTNKFVFVTILFIVILAFMDLVVEPKNSEYLIPHRGITCWGCSHEITGEECDNCGASVIDKGILTRRGYICKNCSNQLFWTYTGKCYYCGEPQDLYYEKFSSKFDSYASYEKQLNQLKMFSNIVVVIIVVYVLTMITLLTIKLVKSKRGGK